MDLFNLAEKYKQNSIQDRYVTNAHIYPFLKELPDFFNLKVIGKSVLNNPIYSICIGSGPVKVLIWSQMHGNESTTTKGIIDFLAYLNSESSEVIPILESFTFFIIPILNPDGAEAYTRNNAADVDLNRDSVNLTQPESQLLRNCYDIFKPDFAFNLHDQRSLFAAGIGNHPATISFLSPSFNDEREINGVRLKAMQIIVDINKSVSKYIPNQIGRFDDGFNINCIGDYFTFLGTPTILFEAGHHPNDYQREFTRKIVFVALLEAILSIKSSSFLDNDISEYFDIPENKKLINDILLKNICITSHGNSHRKNLGIQYREGLFDGEILFIPYFDYDLIENQQFGHLEVDATDFEINTNVEIYDLLNKMNLERSKNGVYHVNDLLKN